MRRLVPAFVLWAAPAVLLSSAPSAAEESPAKPQATTNGASSSPPSPSPADPRKASSPNPAPSGLETTSPSAKKADPPAPLEVRVIGDKADALQKIPGSGQLITRKEIARAEPNDVSELLRRVPGLQVRQEESAGLRLDIGVRGLDATRSRRVLILEDGIPVAINPYGEPDLYYSPPIERMRGIEVVKGSGSILFGPQTIGGVINFLTMGPPSERTLRAELVGGEYGYFKALAGYGDKVGDIRYFTQGYFKRSDGFNGQGFHAADVFGKVAFPTGQSGEMTLKIGYHDEGAATSDVGFTRPMFEADPRRPTISPYDDSLVRRFEASLIHETALGEKTRLRTLGYFYTTSRLWHRQDYDRGPLPGMKYERIVGDPTIPNGAIYFRHTDSIRDRSYQVFGVEPRVETRFSTDGVGHTLDFGMRLLYENARRSQLTGRSPGATEGDLTGDERYGTAALSGYVQDRIAFRDDLLVTPGLRIEGLRSERTIKRKIISGAPRDVNITGDNTMVAFIPGIGMVVGSPSAHLFGGLHLGFAPPRVTDAINSSGQVLSLEPERNISYEVGTRVSPRKWLRFDATGFLSNFGNQIIPSNRAGKATTELVNAGKTRHLGVESSATLELGRVFSFGWSLDLGARYTFVRATFAEGPYKDNDLPYAPRHTVSGTIDIEHPIGPGMQVAWTFVDAQFSDEGNTVPVDVSGRVGQLPSRHIVDVAARYRHKKTGLTGFVSVKNALDQIYIGSRRPDGIFPAGIRQISAGLRWEYR